MKNINKRKGIFIFDYTTDIVEGSEIISSEILNIDREIILDYKLALENICIFHGLVGTLKYNCSVLIVNLDEELVESYRLIFDYIANGGDLIYHSGGIVKKLSFEEKRKRTLINKVMKDFKQRRHGCIIVNTPNYIREREISELVLNIRLKILSSNK